MERDFEKRIDALGITRGAYATLSAIHHEKKTKPAELAAFLGVDGAAVTRHLDRVEKQGLIERKSSATDRRSTDISLTTDGIRVVKRGHADSKATNSKFTAGLSAADVDRLLFAIHSMLANADAVATDI